MRKLLFVAAFASLALTAPTVAQVSAGVGHKLPEESQNGTAPSNAKDGNTLEKKRDVYEGRAAAPDKPVWDKDGAASQTVPNNQNKQENGK